MPLDHIKHVLEPYMHNCPSVSMGPKNGCLFPATLTYCVRRWQTGRLWAPQNRCHERLRAKGQEEGKYDGEWGEHRLRSMNGLCLSGTGTGLNLRNSPKHFNGEAEFLPGWSATTENYSQKWDLICCFDFFLVTGTVTGYSFKTFGKKWYSKLTFVVNIKHNYRKKTVFFLCTRLWVSLGLRWVTVGVCGCLWVFTQLSDTEAYFTNGHTGLELCFKTIIFHSNYLVPLNNFPKMIRSSLMKSTVCNTHNYGLCCRLYIQTHTHTYSI